ncbi:Protein of unknown function [Cotesia congregata]|uniref:Uncharacterized protein n=1 Tax=Cotesia congregata TaxID=51543 RepID=A0A8J2H6M2_COTCN|nr:Protein of unknown function [Cotesia congregata]
MWQKIISCCLILTIVGGNRMDIYDSKVDSTERLKSDAELFDTNWDLVKNPLIIIDNAFKKQITGFLPAYPTYVLFFKSVKSLKEIINHLKKSTLWSIKSPFVIVETELRCKSSKKILEFMWMEDLLSVYYLCNKKDLTVILTLNSYARYAPRPWVLIEEFGDSNKKINLYSLNYTKDLRLCKSITFEKTDHLESADIQFSRFESRKLINSRKFTNQILKSLLDQPGATLLHIPGYINATPKLDYILYPNSSQLLQGYVQQLVDRTSDVHVALMPVTETNYKYVDVVADYSHEYEFSIISRKADFFIVLNEVTSDINFVVKTITLSVMFTIAMVLINRDDIREALMDVVRLIVSMGLESPLNRLAIKFIFFFGFLFAFSVVPDFQGHVSAILSSPMKRNVETLKDLHENKFHVYYSDKLERAIVNESLWVTDEDKKYLHPISTEEITNCINDVTTNLTIACIHEANLLQRNIVNYSDIYLSKTPVFKKQLVYWTRKNWPLKTKFDEMALKTLELALLLEFQSKKRDKNAKKISIIKNRIEAGEKYDQFDYDELIFIFYFIGFLSAFGVIVFLIEIIMARSLRIYI